MNVSSTRFYTDDPGRPGAIPLSGLRDPGTYTVRAEWRTPEAFDAYAPNSEPVTFTVGNRVGVETGTPTPAVTATATPTVTVAPTTVTATATVTVTTTETATPNATATTAPATPTPTAAPLPVAAVVGALGLAVILAGRRR